MSSLAKLINDAVQRARLQVGDLAIPFVVKRKTDSTYFGGKNVPNYDLITVYGVHDKFEAHEVDGSLVRSMDNRVMLFIDSEDQVPTTEDLLDERGEVYQVKSSQPIYAGDKIVVAMVHTRK